MNFSEFELDTQVKKQSILKNNIQSLSIGILKESFFGDSRVALTPDDCEILINNGNSICIEKGAGLESNYTDLEYSNAGCEIMQEKKNIFKKDILLRLSPLSIEETEFLNEDQILISPLSTKFQDRQILEKLITKKIKGIFFNYIKDDEGNFMIENTLGQIEGRASILLASEAMSKVDLGLGEMLGGITGIMPTEVVVIGANYIGKYAIKSALGLGANVKLFDNSLNKLNKIKDELGQDIATSLINKKTLTKSLMRCNVLIFAMKNDLISPLIITEDMVAKMKRGSVIVDLSMDNSGGVETSEITTIKNPYIIKKNIIHLCMHNISAKYPRTSSILLSNVFLSKLLAIQNIGVEDMAIKDVGFKSGIITYRGYFTNKKVADFFNFNYTDIDLLLF